MSFLFILYALRMRINHDMILSDMGFYYLNNDNKGNLLCNDVFDKFFEYVGFVGFDSLQLRVKKEIKLVLREARLKC